MDSDPDSLLSELQSEPAHKILKWTVWVLLFLCCKHSPSTFAYWGNANCRKIRGYPRLVCESISQKCQCALTFKKIYLCQSHNHGILGYFPHSPTAPRHVHESSLVKRLGYRTGCELQQQLKASLFFFFLSSLTSGQQSSWGSYLTFIGINMKMHCHWHHS